MPIYARMKYTAVKADVKLATMAASISIYGLDALSEGPYHIEMNIAPTVAMGAITLYINGDTTDADYFAQWFVGISSNTVFINTGSSTIGYPNSNLYAATQIVGDLDLVTTQSNPTYQVFGLFGNGYYGTPNARMSYTYWCRLSGVANINSITINCPSSGFGTGTRITVFKAIR